MNERVKDLSQRCCYVSSRFFKWVYGNPWPLLVGVSRMPAYHVDYTTDLQNPLWDWARIASASASFYSTKSLSIKRRCSLSTDPPIITQKPGVQASTLLHSPPETLSVRGPDIITAFIQWLLFWSTEKNCSNQPHWSQWTLGFNREIHWRYGNVWEGNRVSRPAICSWFWTNSSSRWMCSNAFLVNKVLTQ